MGTPDWNGWLAGVWSGGSSDEGLDWPAAVITAAANIVVGSNPPYTIQDFFAMYPKFAGPVLVSGTSAPTGTLTQGSESITAVNNTAGMAMGQPISGLGIPDNTFISGISGTTVTMTNAASASGTAVPIIVWNATAIPVAVLQVFINLASAHLVQARWQDTWLVGMGLFVAHFATLYAKSDGNPNSTTGQIASQGLADGVRITKSAGDVSVGYSPVRGIDDWGAWNLTSYGQQLATLGKIMGMGGMVVY